MYLRTPNWLAAVMKDPLNGTVRGLVNMFNAQPLKGHLISKNYGIAKAMP